MISEDKIFELAEQADFVMWGDEPWNVYKSRIDWSSEYDEQIVQFARLIEKYVMENKQ